MVIISQRMFFFKYGLLKFAPPLIWCFLVGRDVCRSFFSLIWGVPPFPDSPYLKKWQQSMKSLLGAGWRTMNHESCPVCSFQEVPNLSDKKINQIDRSQKVSKSLTWFTWVWTIPPSNLEETFQWREGWWRHVWPVVDTLERAGASPILDRKLI